MNQANVLSFELLAGQQLALQQVLAALVATHPDLPAFLSALEKQVQRLQRQADGSRLMDVALASMQQLQATYSPKAP